MVEVVEWILDKGFVIQTRFYPRKCFGVCVLVVLALFVLIAISPVSAISANPATGLFNGSVIMGGTPVPTVFIGEDQLNKHEIGRAHV